ncbi:MAG: hypothetical protein SNJ60_04465 [Pseudanabaenaceae cyanobacterium]
MNPNSSDLLDPDFKNKLTRLQSYFESVVTEYQEKLTHAQQRLAEVNSLLASLDGVNPLRSGTLVHPEALSAPTGSSASAPPSGPVMMEAEVAPPIAPATPSYRPKGRPKANPTPKPPVRSGGKSSRRRDIELLPPFAGQSVSSAIAKLLELREGHQLHIDDVTRGLYGDKIDPTQFAAAKETVMKILSQGKQAGRWHRVPDKTGYYTLTLKSL